MKSWIIETKDLTKKYGNILAVDALNMRVRPGEVCGLVGPHGSGKTTTIQMILGQTEPTSGKVEVFGVDPTRYPLSMKALVGYLPIQLDFSQDLTARENLIYIARLNELPHQEVHRRIDIALERVGLTRMANLYVSKFSYGMQLRLALAGVLIKKPRLIVMDEPTQRLDNEMVRKFLQLIRKLAGTGITILLSSQVRDQVQEACDQIVVFKRDCTVFQGPTQNLAQGFVDGDALIRLRANGSVGVLLDELRYLPSVSEVIYHYPDRYVLKTPRDLRAEVAKKVVDAGGKLISLEFKRPNLETVYASYVEKENLCRSEKPKENHWQEKVP